MKTYFMGIGGMAMGNVALLAKQLGHNVLGSDTAFFPPLRAALKEMEIYETYSAARLQNLSPDLVVVGNSIGRGHEELEWFWSRKPYDYASMPEFLRTHVIKNRPTVVVCGTHGKTTTTTLTAYLLNNASASKRAGWLIGGVPNPADLPAGAFLGASDGPFVIEGDEYDSAFFDKRAKFISYTPTVAVLNNLELDHTDIYRDLDDLKRSFNHLLRTVPGNGLVIANADDTNIRSLLPVSWVKHTLVGQAPEAELQIRDFSENAEGSRFSLYYKGQFWAQIDWALTGLFNARNAAMAALAAAWTTAPNAHPTTFDISALNRFQGVKRRAQLRYRSEKLMVIEDFGHHPTAVELTLRSLRNRFPGYKFLACFEPRSNTSRTNSHQENYPPALAIADASIIAPVYKEASLPQERRLNTAKIAQDLTSLGRIAHAATQISQLCPLIEEITTAGGPWCVVFFSNGNFEGQFQKYLDSLPASVPAFAEKTAS